MKEHKNAGFKSRKRRKALLFFVISGIIILIAYLQEYHIKNPVIFWLFILIVPFVLYQIATDKPFIGIDEEESL